MGGPVSGNLTSGGEVVHVAFGAVDAKAGGEKAESGGELDLAVEHHPAGKAVSERERALLEAKKWSSRVQIAREAYAEALAECRRAGLSNVAIARAVNKSEAAIRMHFGRRSK